VTDSAPVPVLVVDDQAPFRRAARSVIGATDGFTVVGEAVTAEEALTLVADLCPQLVVMDINLPGMSGIEATRLLTATNPEIVVILVSTYRAEDLPGNARASGAVAYVHKERLGTAVLRDVWQHRADGEFVSC
jgi:DNA-binding NarL/FixJ family response regulator